MSPKNSHWGITKIHEKLLKLDLQRKTSPVDYDVGGWLCGLCSRHSVMFYCGEGNGNPLQYFCLENPVTEETGGLLSIGSHRVGHDWRDLACMHALEKEMATHSSILAWRIPGMREPSMGLHRVGHEWSDLAAAVAAAAAAAVAVFCWKDWFGYYDDMQFMTW